MKTKKLVCLALIALSIPLLAACGETVRILSYYGDMRGVLGGQRSGAHAGVDVDGLLGDPVIAAADGVVEFITGDPEPTRGCGRGVLLRHRAGDKSYYTVYCHLDQISVRWTQAVKRGDEVGKMGTTGRSMGVPHVHFEVCVAPCPGGHESGNLEGTLDPLPLIVGCFDPGKNEMYTALAKEGGTPRLILTYPVRCAPTKKARTSR